MKRKKDAAQFWIFQRAIKSKLRLQLSGNAQIAITQFAEMPFMTVVNCGVLAY